jgi:chaperone required for assembly of F1-ATPase
MAEKLLTQAVKEIAAHRKEMIAKLLEFAQTDLLFFWGEKKDLYLRQEKEWMPILEWASGELHVEIAKTDCLDVPDNSALNNPLKCAFNHMTDKELAAFYVAALNMRSVLLAMALVKGRIDAEEAYRLSYLEELWQNEHWGQDLEAEAKRLERRTELREVEQFLRS